MGNSSKKSASPSYSSTNIKNYNKSLKKFRSTDKNFEKLNRLYKWKLKAEELIKEQSQLNKSWKEFEDFISQKLQEHEDSEDQDWIALASPIILTPLSFKTQFARKNEPKVFDFNKYNKEKSLRDSNDSSFSFNGSPNASPAKSDGLQLNTDMIEDFEFKETVLTAPNQSILSLSISKKISQETKLRNAREELDKILMYQMKAFKNPFSEIVSFFHKKFDQLFESEYKCLLNSDSFDKKSEISLRTLKEIIFTLRDTLKASLIYLYEDLLKQFQEAIENEDSDLDCLLEGIIFDLIFENSESNMFRVINTLLIQKNYESSEKMNKTINMKKKSKLCDYDDNFKSDRRFLLIKNPQPYVEVIKLLLDISHEKNPYKKFQKLMGLEQKIVDSALDYYNECEKEQEKVQTSLGMDTKIPITIFCIVQTHTSNLLIDKSFIEEFVSESLYENSQAYTMFSSCLQYLIEFSSDAHP